MEVYEATEIAYKNGYADGYKAAKAEFEKRRAEEIKEIAERWEKDD
jgi:flagellar biosynthesis/type III secretory pathway protein FliH